MNKSFGDDGRPLGDKENGLYRMNNAELRRFAEAELLKQRTERAKAANPNASADELIQLVKRVGRQSHPREQHRAGA